VKAARQLGVCALALVLFGCGPATAGGGEREVPAEASQTGSPAAEPSTASSTPAATRAPIVETRQVTETQPIPFQTRTVNDAKLAQGTSKVRTKGAAGVRTLVYEVTLTDGVQTARKLLSETVTRAPVTEVIAVGTKPASRCDPNYSGACVPIASDVDCAGGSGNGPAYVRGPVYVIGRDIYDLDRDGDGVGCE
jgi:hypothetical protein